MLNRLVVNFHAAACPFWVSVSVKTGMKAAVTTPSPKILRCILGIRKATKNASADADEPNAMAITISRRNPKILDNRVIPPTAPAALLTFLLLSIKGVVQVEIIERVYMRFCLFQYSKAGVHEGRILSRL